jgi:hypothetical protein
MNNFNRIFGSGPIGLLISMALFIIFFYLKDLFDIPRIAGDQSFIPLSIFLLFTAVSVAIIIWSLVSLNPKLRGKALITTGGEDTLSLHDALPICLAFLLNNWIFIIWAVLLHPVWHLLVIREEKDLKILFPGEYEDYCRNTGRFIPGIFRRR